MSAFKIPKDWFNDARLVEPSKFDPECRDNWVSKRDCNIANLKKKCDILKIKYKKRRPGKPHLVTRLRAFLRMATAGGEEVVVGSRERLRIRTPHSTTESEDEQGTEDEFLVEEDEDEDDGALLDEQAEKEFEEEGYENEETGEERMMRERSEDEEDQPVGEEEEEEDLEDVFPVEPARRKRKSATKQLKKSNKRQSRLLESQQLVQESVQEEDTPNPPRRTTQKAKASKKSPTTGGASGSKRPQADSSGVSTTPPTEDLQRDPGADTVVVTAAPPLKVQVSGGFDLTQAARRVSMSLQFSALALDVATFYDADLPVMTPTGQLMHDAMVHVESPIVGDVVVVPHNRYSAHFSVDHLVQQVYYYYQIDSIMGENIDVSYLTLNLPKGNDGSSIDPIPKSVIRLKKRSFLLVVRGLIADDVKTFKVARPEEAGAAPNKSTTGMKVVYDEMNEREVNVHQKTNIVERLTNSNMARRMMEPDIYVELRLTDVDLDIKRLFQLLVNVRGTEWLHDRPKGLVTVEDDHHSRHYRQIHNLPCVKTVAVIEKFLTIGSPPVPGSPYQYQISLDDFVARRLDMACASKATVKNDLVSALSNFVFFMWFLCGDIYYGICDEIRISLQTGVLAKESWDCNYVRYEIEKAMSFALSEIRLSRKSVFMRRHSTMDITVPHGVRQWFSFAFQHVLPDLESMISFQKAVPSPAGPYAHHASNVTSGGPRPTTTFKAMPAVRTPAASNPVVPNSTKTSTSSRAVCRIQFCHDLDMVNSVGVIFKQCSMGKNCRYMHGCVKTGSKKTHLNAIVEDLMKHPSCSSSLGADMKAAIALRP